MPTFPTIPPSFVTPSLPDYKVSMSEFDDGSEQRVQTQFTGNGTGLSLRFEALTAQQVADLTAFWKEVGGTAKTFVFPTALYQYPVVVTSAIASLGYTTEWRFTKSFSFQPVRVGNECAIFSTAIELKSVIA